jgi:hypothetical protein
MFRENNGLILLYIEFLMPVWYTTYTHTHTRIIQRKDNGWNTNSVLNIMLKIQAMRVYKMSREVIRIWEEIQVLTPN